MGKKTIPTIGKTNSQSIDNRTKGNLKDKKRNSKKSDPRDQSIDPKSLIKEPKLDVCSICLNQIQKPSLCSGCFHSFCFNCITKWSNLSNNCPVCRKEYKNIWHNFNTAVEIIKFKPAKRLQNNSKKDSLDNNESNAESSMSNVKKANANKKEAGKFFIFENGEQRMIGIPVLNDEQVTNNIVLLNTINEDNIPEVDIVNMTKDEKGVRIVTRHNHQLASADQQELFNELITSAVNRSVEDHREAIKQIKTNKASDELKRSNTILDQDQESPRLIDIYTFDRTRRLNRRRNRNQNYLGPSRYNLRPILGTRTNPYVNRTRLIEWNI